MASVSGPILWLSEPNMGVGAFKKEVAGLSSNFVLIVLIATSLWERDFEGEGCAQAAEVLLMMRPEGEASSDFQEYTLVALFSLAAHLAGGVAAETASLPAMARYYKQDLDVLQQVSLVSHCYSCTQTPRISSFAILGFTTVRSSLVFALLQPSRQLC